MFVKAVARNSPQPWGPDLLGEIDSSCFGKNVLGTSCGLTAHHKDAFVKAQEEFAIPVIRWLERNWENNHACCRDSRSPAW